MKGFLLLILGGFVACGAEESLQWNTGGAGKSDEYLGKPIGTGFITVKGNPDSPRLWSSLYMKRDTATAIDSPVFGRKCALGLPYTTNWYFILRNGVVYDYAENHTLPQRAFNKSYELPAGFTYRLVMNNSYFDVEVEPDSETVVHAARIEEPVGKRAAWYKFIPPNRFCSDSVAPLLETGTGIYVMPNNNSFYSFTVYDDLGQEAATRTHKLCNCASDDGDCLAECKN